MSNFPQLGLSSGNTWLDIGVICYIIGSMLSDLTPAGKMIAVAIPFVIGGIIKAICEEENK